MRYIDIVYEVYEYVPPRLSRCGLTLLIARLVGALLLGALLVGCPLPFEFTGEGSGIAGKRKLNGSTITAPVTFTYAEASGGTGVIAHGGSHTSNADITITLNTNTPNATLYYTTDGSRITELSAAPVTRVDGSATTYEIALTNAIQKLTIHALAIGPHMRPGPITTAEIEVLPLWILTYNPNYPSGDGGGTFSGGAIPPVSKHPEGTTISLIDPRRSRDDPRRSREELRYTIGDRIYEFDGWNDRADGTGTTYNYSLTDLASAPPPTLRAANATLYAKWVRLYRIRYFTPRSDTPSRPQYYRRVDGFPVGIPLLKTVFLRPPYNYNLPTGSDTYTKPDGTPATKSDGTDATINDSETSSTLRGWLTVNTGTWNPPTTISGVTVVRPVSDETGLQTATANTDWYARWN